MKFKCSIDTPVKVKLTPHGKAIMQGLLTSVVRKRPQDHTVLLKTDEEGYITLSIWQLTTYFGWMTSYLEDGSIYFEVEEDAPSTNH